MTRDCGHILAYDLGTTACKAVVWRADGQVLAEASEEYPTRFPRPAWAEQDPDDWWDALIRATARLAPRDLLDRVIGIGLSSQRESIVPIDQDGQKLADSIIWMDRRSEPEAQAIAAAFGRDQVQIKTGLPPDPTFTATKLLWLKRHDPGLLSRARYFLQPRDFLYLRLTGVVLTDYSLASRTLLLDVRTRTWWREMCEFVGIRVEQMPPLFASTEAPGRVCAAAARLLGVRNGVPVAVGGGDRPCETLGAGGLQGQVVESTGTATSLNLTVDSIPEQPDPKVVYSVHVVPDRWLLEQGLSPTGAIMRWYRDLLGEADYRSIDDAIAKTPAGANGLVLLPFFMGAKSVRWNTQARGVLFGLTLGHGRGEIGRAIMEGVGFEIRACLELLARIAATSPAIIAVGGGARSALWNQIKSDICQRPVVRVEQTDAANLGAMILAGMAIGLYDDPVRAAATFNPPTETFWPSTDLAEIYHSLFEKYNALYAACQPLFSDAPFTARP